MVASRLANPTATKNALEASGLNPKYRFGQNFLINDAIVGKIIHLAEIQPGDKIVEIGPGLGTLTLGLINADADVFAIEVDSEMYERLQTTNALTDAEKQHFFCINQDALKVKDKQILEFCQHESFKLVSNLPYSVAATVVLDYFKRFANMQSATVMVQSEVADRMAAEVGTKNYGAYTVKLAMYTEIAGKFKVSANNFMPPPRVESAVIRLNRKCAFDVNLLQKASKIADAAFANRRKTINNSVKNYFSSNPDIAVSVLEAFEKCNISTSLRAEKITPCQFIDVAKASMI